MVTRNTHPATLSRTAARAASGDLVALAQPWAGQTLGKGLVGVR
jgi:hypothetical protein